MPKPLSLRNYLGYATGDAANNFAFSTMSLFLTVYYTQVVGLDAAPIGTMFLIVKFWDAITDVIAGRIVDSTATRWGKFRPFLLWGALPLMALNFATFHVPAWSSQSDQLVYAYISYALVGFAYSMVNIPYGSLASAMTQVPEERGKLAAFRSSGAAITVILLSIVMGPFIKDAPTQSKFTLFTLIFVVVGVALYIFTFSATTENVTRRSPKTSLRDTVNAIRCNRPLLMLCAAAIVFLVGMTATQGILLFYAIEVLHNASLFVWMSGIQAALIFVIAPFSSYIVRVIGKKRGFMAGCAIVIIGGVIMYAAGSTVPLALTGYYIMGFGIALVNMLMWSLEADTIEYAEWKNGERAEGAIYSVFSFMRKMGQALGSAVPLWIMGAAGFISTKQGQAVVQSDSAIWAIKFSMSILPAIGAAIALVIFMFYPLTEAFYQRIMVDINAAKQAGAETTPAAPATLR